MRIISMDTSLGACSVAALEWVDGQEHVRGHVYKDMNRGHAEALMDIVAEVEADSGFGVLECTRLAVTVGPGTFTGLRVGLAAARGFALAAEKPLIGITSLQAIARGAETEGPVAVILDARRGDVYFGVFEAGPARALRVRPCVLPLAEAAERLAGEGACDVIGTGVSVLRSEGYDVKAEIGGKVQPDALQIARLAALVEDPATAPATPLYLRAPDAKLPSGNPLA